MTNEDSTLGGFMFVFVIALGGTIVFYYVLIGVEFLTYLALGAIHRRAVRKIKERRQKLTEKQLKPQDLQ